MIITRNNYDIDQVATFAQEIINENVFLLNYTQFSRQQIIT